LNNDKNSTISELENNIIRQCMSSGIHWSDFEFEGIVIDRIVSPDNRMMEAVRGKRNGNPSIRTEQAISAAIEKYQAIEATIPMLRFCRLNRGRSLYWAAKALGFENTISVQRAGARCLAMGLGEDFSLLMDGSVPDDHGEITEHIGSGCYQKSSGGRVAL
jgi:hypothetical protein